jgi:hypothetical protein
MSKLSFVIYKFWRDVYIIKDVERLIIDPYLTHGSNIYIYIYIYTAKFLGSNHVIQETE